MSGCVPFLLMKVNCRPVKLVVGYAPELLKCSACKEAWRLYKKARRFEKKKAYKYGRWLRVKAAKLLYEDRENHLENAREIPLIIVCGAADRQKVNACWNCNKGLYASWSKYYESIFCKFCFATLFTDWLDGKIDDKGVQKLYEDRQKEPYMASGLWEDFRWSKKKQDLVRRKKK